MKKILIVTGPLYPNVGHNASLVCKLLPYLKERFEIRFLSLVSGADGKALPEKICDTKTYWANASSLDPIHRNAFRLGAKCVDRHGRSDAFDGMLLAHRAREIRKEFQYDIVLCSSEPFIAAVASALLPGNIKKALYIMDPPEVLWDKNVIPFRKKYIKHILKKQDIIFTTKYAIEALKEQGFGKCCKRLVEVLFPMIEDLTFQPTPQDLQMAPDKINLLYCGNMSKALERSPQFYLDVASKLDERFCLYFMGWYCDTIREDYNLSSSANIVTLPQQPYQTALNAMRDADVLINIGNNVRVHLPSKIIEYINLCKPIINIYKYPSCPTLDFTQQYPLSLNLAEYELSVDEAAKRLTDFCLRVKGKEIETDHEWVKEHYSAARPEVLSDLIAGELNQL